MIDPLPTLFDAPVDVSAPIASGVRSSDPETSHQAAKDPAAKVRRGSQRGRLLEAYGRADLTDDEAAIATEIRGAWKRCSELRAMDLIRPTGAKRDSRDGSPMRVCAITFAGRSALNTMGES